MSHRARGAAGTAALPALIAGLACGKAPPPPPPPPPEVRVIEVREEDVPIYSEWIGTLDGWVNAQIRAQVSGYLLTRSYREGALVKKGDLLFEIDPRPLRAVLQQANGRLGQARAQLGKAEADVARYRPLAGRGSISREELENAEHALDAARADVVAARAGVAQAELNLGFCRITSPIDGIAGLARAQVGDLVGPGGNELTTVSTLDPIKADFSVSEEEYLASRSFWGDHAGNSETAPLELTLATGEVYPERGKVYAAQRQVGVRTGSLTLVGLFPNPGNLLRPGQFARIRAAIAVRRAAILVPVQALIDRQGVAQVAVVDREHHAHLRQVEAGEQSGGERVIRKGLAAGEVVVVEGLQKVKEGAPVTPRPFTAKAAAMEAR